MFVGGAQFATQVPTAMVPPAVQFQFGGIVRYTLLDASPQANKEFLLAETISIKCEALSAVAEAQDVLVRLRQEDSAEELGDAVHCEQLRKKANKAMLRALH